MTAARQAESSITPSARRAISLSSPSLRTTNSSPPYALHDRALRNERYKLIRRLDTPDEFYDLSADPFESTDLLRIGLTPGERDAFAALEAELAALGVE